MVQAKRIRIIRQLKRELVDLNKGLVFLEASIARRVKEIYKLTTAQTSEEEIKRRIEFQIAEMKNRIFARTPLDPKFLKVRSTFISKLILAQSERITVARKNVLLSEVEERLSVLQGMCGHRFIFSYDGYGGSRANDFDDQYQGHRVCVLCNRHESSESTCEGIYTVFADDGTRLIRRDLRDKKDLPKPLENEWFSIGFIHQLFEASAGGINVKWPKVFDSCSVLKF